MMPDREVPPGEAYDADGRLEEQMFIDDILRNGVSSARHWLKKKSPDKARTIGQHAVLALEDGVTAREADGKTIDYIKFALQRAHETNWTDEHSITALINYIEGLFPQTYSGN